MSAYNQCFAIEESRTHSGHRLRIERFLMKMVSHIARYNSHNKLTKLLHIIPATAWKPSFENVQFGPFHLLNEKEARLPCKPSTGAPQPSYRWFKDGELITYEENSRYKLDMDGTLVIKEVDKDQDGVNYTCKASNLMGEDSITTVPIILGKQCQFYKSVTDFYSYFITKGNQFKRMSSILLRLIVCSEKDF